MTEGPAPSSCGSAVVLGRLLSAIGCVAHHQLLHLEHATLNELKRRARLKEGQGRTSPTPSKTARGQTPAGSKVSMTILQLCTVSIDTDKIPLLVCVCNSSHSYRTTLYIHTYVRTYCKEEGGSGEMTGNGSEPMFSITNFWSVGGCLFTPSLVYSPLAFMYITYVKRAWLTLHACTYTDLLHIRSSHSCSLQYIVYTCVRTYVCTYLT